MAAPLERLDRIRDDLISRGIGTSGLTQQAIQRANLPSLREELVTSRAIQAEKARRKQARVGRQRLESARTLLGNLSGGQTRGGRVAGLSPTAPVGVVLGQRSRDPRQQGRERFGFTIQTPGGQKRTFRGRLEDVISRIEEFQRAGGQVISEGVLPDIAESSRERLQRLGVIPVGTPQAEQLFLGRRRRGVATQFGSLQRLQRILAPTTEPTQPELTSDEKAVVEAAAEVEL